MTKIIANYLPQYHRIPENDRWWGTGYTDWFAVKNSKPLYEGHNQPRVPLNEHYYDLNCPDEIRRQAKLAKEYGIYGWGIYHYWFSDELCLLDSPVQHILNNEDIDINYMLIWDNASWKRTWSNIKQFSNDWAPLYEEQKERTDDGKLAELKYGNKKNWEKHFEYLLPFFKDKRYIKLDNKPMFAFFNQDNDQNVLKQMIQCWNELAKKHGFGGICFIGKKKNMVTKIVDFEFTYEPEWSGWTIKNYKQRLYNKIKLEISKKGGMPLRYKYKKIWRRILKDASLCMDNTLFFGGFVSYDDTPRRGSKGRIVEGNNPEEYEEYLKRLVEISEAQGKEFVFITAWNEWGEGAYLEPDENTKYEYLEATRGAIASANRGIFL